MNKSVSKKEMYFVLAALFLSIWDTMMVNAMLPFYDFSPLTSSLTIWLLENIGWEANIALIAFAFFAFMTFCSRKYLLPIAQTLAVFKAVVTGFDYFHLKLLEETYPLVF
jgi:hypothetical protein